MIDWGGVDSWRRFTLERLKTEGLLQGGQGEDDLDSALGVINAKDDDTFGDNDAELDDVEGS